MAPESRAGGDPGIYARDSQLRRLHPLCGTRGRMAHHYATRTTYVTTSTLVLRLLNGGDDRGCMKIIYQCDYGLQWNYQKKSVKNSFTY